MHPVGKAIGWIEKMIGTVFHSLDVFYHHPKFGEAYNAVGAKIWCFCDFIFLSRSEAGTLFVPGGILCAVFLSLFIGRFDAVFRLFFRRIALSDGLDSSHFCCLVAKFHLKIAKSRKSAENLCAPLRTNSRNILIKFHLSGLGPKT